MLPLTLSVPFVIWLVKNKTKADCPSLACTASKQVQCQALVCRLGEWEEEEQEPDSQGFEAGTQICQAPGYLGGLAP